MPSPRRARSLAIANLVVVISVVGWNYWTAVNGFQGRTVGGMGDIYRTLFTPAPYAFSIWGIIFLGLFANGGYQLWLAFRAEAPHESESWPGLAEHRTSFSSHLGPWLIATNLANGLWVLLWLSEQTAASVVTLGAMFVFLQIAIRRLDMAVWDAPFEVIALVWWPIAVYAGWVTVAVLANLSAFLAKHGVVPGDSEAWSLAMIVIATVVNIALVVRRNLREHAMVAVWALIAISVRQWGRVASVQWGAVGAALILTIVVAAHAFANRRTLPGLRAR